MRGVALAELPHQARRVRDRRIDAGVVRAVEAEHGRSYPPQGLALRRRSVIDDRGSQAVFVSGEFEARRPAPAKADAAVLAVGRRARKSRNAPSKSVCGTTSSVRRSRISLTASCGSSGVRPAGAVAAQQIGRDGDEAFGGELVGHGADPVRQTEDLMDHDDGRGAGRPLGIRHPGVNRVASTNRCALRRFRSIRRGAGMRSISRRPDSASAGSAPLRS